jgi:alpha-galactosidase
MTLWSMSSAQLYTGSDLTNLDSFDLGLLTNDEVIAVDQAGHPAHPVGTVTTTNQQVWYANNGDGSYTVGLFNLAAAAATVTVNWSDIGLNGSATVRDLWTHTDLGTFNSSFSSTSLPSHASRLLRVVTNGGSVTANNDEAKFTGAWQRSYNRGFGDYKDDVQYTTTNNDYFEYTFKGTGVDMITEKDSSQGNVDIYIDGVFKQTVSTYNATRLAQQTVYSITGLTNASHTIKGVKKTGTYMLLDKLSFSVAAPIHLNDTDAGITYSGAWSLSSNRGFGDYQDDVHWTQTNNDYFQYSFTGTGIDFITEKDPSGGNIDIYVDNVFKQTVSAYNATRLAQQTVYSISGLSSGSHTIKGVKKSGTFMLLDRLSFTGGAKIQYNNTAPGMSYTGAWSLNSNRGFGDYNNDVHFSMTNNDYFQFTFTGTGIEWITEKDNALGNVDIYVDNVFKQTVSAYSASRLVQQSLYSITGLTNTSHIFKAVKKTGTYMINDTLRVTP